MTVTRPVVMVTLALSLLAAPLAAEAQPTGRFHRVGLLTTGGVSTERSASFDAFRQSLRELEDDVRLQITQEYEA